MEAAAAAQEMIQKLDNLGYRLTPQRMLVLQAVSTSNGHISAEDILTSVRVRFPYVSISTIYRTLDLLEEIGFVTKSDLGIGRVQYHRADDAHHHHLVCRHCGRVVDLEEQELAPVWDMLRRRHRFTVCQRHMAIFGLCERCCDVTDDSQAGSSCFEVG